MTDGAAPQRRMSREDRREQLLDALADLVLTEGAAAVTVERLAEWAGVSRALVYQHATDREDLLVQLYERERARFDERGRTNAAGAHGVAELLQAMHGAYLDAVEERGALFVRLVGEPSVAGKLERIRDLRQDETVSFWTSQAEEIGIDPVDAGTLAVSFAAAALASGDLLLQGVPRALVEEHFYRLVGGTFSALATAPAR
jgi:AcrR family transcriptional regulator